MDLILTDYGISQYLNLKRLIRQFVADTGSVAAQHSED
jgi:hypothetical protein